MTANLDALTGGEFSAVFELVYQYTHEGGCIIKESLFELLARSLRS